MQYKQDYAYEQIKNIVKHLDPRDKTTLSENSLSEQLHISRSPVRQALLRLQYEGLIIVVPHQGIVVREVSYEEARELFDLRGTVENYLISQSIKLLLEADIRELEGYIEKQKECVARQDYDGYFKYDDLFHLTSYRHYNNDIMKTIVQNFKDRFYRARYRTLTVTGQAERSIKEHEQVLRFCRDGKYEEAEKLLSKHLWNLEDQITSGSWQIN